MENSEKNLRAQKRQRSHNKKTYLNRDKSYKAENSNSSGLQNDSEPQPQRVNRRDRNEQKPSEVESPRANVPGKSNVEQPIVDHSHLKRETEEIEKLTKKFSRREVTSNWNRYAATENIAADAATEEEALADFCDLLQVPSSRGGHLQLKEEQDWSSASDALVGGYFALDLKMLSMGLTCIPTYERLQLPKRIFSEEDMDCFNNLADQAKQRYNVEKMEDPSENVSHLLKKLVLQEDKPKQILEVQEAELNGTLESENSMSQAEQSFNILDVTKSEQKLLDLDLTLCDDKYSDESLISDTKAFENKLISSVNRATNLDNSKKVSATSNKNKGDDSLPENRESTFILDAKCVYSDENEISIKEKNEESRANITSVASESKSGVNIAKAGSKNISSVKNVYPTKSSYAPTGAVPIESSESPVTQSKTPKSRREDNINEAADKNRQSSKTISPAKEIKTDVSETKVISLEDDDDLDFLLALKTPVSPQNVKSKCPTACVVKDSSFLPGGAAAPQPTAADTHSELDSWLDSVLED